MFAEKVRVGTTFTYIDTHGKVWTAKVTNRTEYFVDIEKTVPYKERLGDEYREYWQDAPKEYERCEIVQVKERVPVRKMGLFGKMVDSYEYVPIEEYGIYCKTGFQRKHDAWFKMDEGEK